MGMLFLVVLQWNENVLGVICKNLRVDLIITKMGVG